MGVSVGQIWPRARRICAMTSEVVSGVFSSESAVAAIERPCTGSKSCLVLPDYKLSREHAVERSNAGIAATGRRCQH